MGSRAIAEDNVIIARGGASNGDRNGGQRSGRSITCFTCGGWGHTSAQCPTFQAQTNLVASNESMGQVDELAENLQYTFFFMMAVTTTIQFLLIFGN